jgi:hypothetical protein
MCGCYCEDMRTMKGQKQTSKIFLILKNTHKKGLRSYMEDV